VADNHSEDGTLAVVRSFSSGSLSLVYELQPRNMGFAANLNLAVASAKATHCWLMGSDDRLIPGALGAVLGQIDATPADVLLGHKVVGGVEREYLANTRRPTTFEVRTEDDLLDFVVRCNEVSALFAFISTLVIRKEVWDSISLTDTEALHPYTHVLRLFRALRRAGSSIRYFPTPIVDCGSVANEFSAAFHRHAVLDAEMLERVSGYFTDRPRAREALAMVFRKQYSTPLILIAKAHATREDWSAALPLVHAARYSRVAVRAPFLDGVVRVLYGVARAAKRAPGRVRHHVLRALRL
jgi:abequosyltransferase